MSTEVGFNLATAAETSGTQSKRYGFKSFFKRSSNELELLPTEKKNDKRYLQFTEETLQNFQKVYNAAQEIGGIDESITDHSDYYNFGNLDTISSDLLNIFDSLHFDAKKQIQELKYENSLLKEECAKNLIKLSKEIDRNGLLGEKIRHCENGLLEYRTRLTTAEFNHNLAITKQQKGIMLLKRKLKNEQEHEAEEKNMVLQLHNKMDVLQNFKDQSIMLMQKMLVFWRELYSNNDETDTIHSELIELSSKFIDDTDAKDVIEINALTIACLGKFNNDFFAKITKKLLDLKYMSDQPTEKSNE